MAKRPIFMPGHYARELVKEVYIDFAWHPGFSVTQKEKSIESLHQSAREAGINNILEISTKSPLQIGKDLSAFNMQFQLESHIMCVEAAFQGSKVFEYGGPFTDIYGLSGFDAKKDRRLRNSGTLAGFDLMGDRWLLEPVTAFYDWIYITAVHQNPTLASQLTQFDGFSDIEFNPKKSFNCQARSAALYVALKKLNLLDDALIGKKNYLQIISPERDRNTFSQSSLPGFS